VLKLFAAPEEDADAIAAGEYTPPPRFVLNLPDDLGVDDLGIDELGVLDSLMFADRIDPGHSVLDEGPIAESEDAEVFLALPEFVDRLADQAWSLPLRRWTVYLNGGEADGAWTDEKAERVAQESSSNYFSVLSSEIIG
jgi:hypothetical protein